MRPVISYDDISLPYQATEITPVAPRVASPKPPSSKKRKRSNQKPKNTPPQHWDDPGLPDDSVNYEEDYVDNESTGVAVEDDDQDDEESRELTYEEIWDDSALIDAWNAATEEYETYNGPKKDWKKEPVNKSPLWYNVPSSPSKKKAKLQTMSRPIDGIAGDADAESDSRPLNFHTFVPTHDPSLDIPVLPNPSPVPGPDYSAFYLPEPPGPMASQDEAFSRALAAMYWGGYWTAVYHSRRGVIHAHPAEVQDDLSEKEDEENFVPTQR